MRVKSGLNVYEKPNGLHLASWSNRARETIVEYDEQGELALTTFIPLSVQGSYRAVDHFINRHIVLGPGGQPIWQGRIEDLQPVDGGLNVTAMGYRRAFMDAPYTGLWSTKKYGPWEQVTELDISSTWTPGKYEMDNNNRLRIALRKNETYAHGSDTGAMFFRIPHRGRGDISKIAFDYDVTLPTDWVMRTQTADDDFSNNITEDTITGNGASQTGSKSLTSLTANREMVILYIRNTTGSAYTNNGETDDWFANVTNIRIQTTDGATIYADEIVKDLHSFITEINSDQLAAGLGWVQSPSVDIGEAVYEDKLPADIMNLLGRLGDNSSPPQPYLWGVRGRYLYFWPRGTNRIDWAAKQAGVDLRLSLDAMSNSAYAVYQNERGELKRTTVATGDSVNRYNLTRRAAVSVTSTTSDSVAQGERDRFVEQNQDALPRAIIRIERLKRLDGSAIHPKHDVRGGDSMTISNWPTGSGLLRDVLQSFTVRSVKYNVDKDELDVVPDLDPATVDYLLARGMVDRSGRAGADQWR